MSTELIQSSFYTSIPSAYPSLQAVPRFESFAHFGLPASKQLKDEPKQYFFRLPITPKLTFEFVLDPTGKPGKFNIISSEETVMDGVVSTRLIYEFISSKPGRLFIPEKGLRLNIILSDSEKRLILNKAKLYRKLLFIEDSLNTKISLPAPPEEITSNDLSIIDTIFRGISRGNVYTEMDNITLGKSAMQGDDEEIPQSSEPFPISFDLEGMELFNKRLPLETIRVIIPHARREILEQPKTGPEGYLKFKFTPQDKRVIYHFKKYAGNLAEQQRLLEDFRNQLALIEPEELANLVLEPFSGSISSGEAIEIAYSHFKIESEGSILDSIKIDVYPPHFDSYADLWRVFLMLKDSTLESPGLAIGIMVDKKTGKIINPGSAEEKERNKRKFRCLADKWHAGQNPFSSIIDLDHPAYQEIIDMGMDAVPLILRELQQDPDYWFWALKAITGDDPVPKESLGNLQHMTEDWLKWGREKGHIE